MSLDPRQQTGLQQMQTMHDASLSGLRADFFYWEWITPLHYSVFIFSCSHALSMLGQK